MANSTIVCDEKVYQSGRNIRQLLVDKRYAKHAESINTRIIELAYVMHLQAEGYTTEQFNAETEDDYIVWLEQFDFTELLQHAPEILGIWVDTSKQQSKSKKKSS